MQNLIKKAAANHSLSRQEIISILQDNSHNHTLFQTADQVRKQYVGDEIHLRALIEFSNICKNNCLYCGLRRENKNISRYRMDAETIFSLAQYAAQNMSLKTVVLQSGEDMYFTQDIMCEIIKKIKTLNIALTLSIGEKSLAEYQAYKKAGADRFLLRIETTDQNLYHKLDPEMDWENRLQCLKNIQTSGLEVGSGIMVGLPEQTIESIADDILFFKEINADMIGIGPFIPHPDTPLKNEQGGNFTLSLKTMALTRLLLPDINIPATTAMETIAPNGQLMALQSGANVIMPNVTLNEYRKHYEIYPGKSSTNYTPAERINILKDKISSIGRSVSNDFGFHKNR